MERGLYCRDARGRAANNVLFLLVFILLHRSWAKIMQLDGIWFVLIHYHIFRVRIEFSPLSYDITHTHKIYTKRSSYLQIRWSCGCFIGSRIGKNLFLLRPKKYWLIRMNCIIHFYLKFYFQNPEKSIINLYKICFFLLMHI